MTGELNYYTSYLRPDAWLLLGDYGRIEHVTKAANELLGEPTSFTDRTAFYDWAYVMGAA